MGWVAGKGGGMGGWERRRDGWLGKEEGWVAGKGGGMGGWEIGMGD